MERGNERLTEARIRTWAREAAAGSKLFDGRGLHLAKLPSGTLAWRLKYAHNGREKLYSIGLLDDVPLPKAREAARIARELVKQGLDPVQQRLVQRALNTDAAKTTFAAVAQEWLVKMKATWMPSHYTRSKRAIERDVLPSIGKLPVAQVEPSMIADVIEHIQRRGVRDTAQKILQHVRAIFDFAIAKGHRNDNPAGAADQIIAPARPIKHRAALLDFAQLGNVLRKMDAAAVTPEVRLCHRLIALTAVRIQNAVEARWSDFHLSAQPPVWIIPRERMKVRSRGFPHKVILPHQLVAELRKWREAQRSDGEERELLFAAGDNGHISREAIEKALRVTLGLRGKHTAHGWRAAFKTLASDSGEFDELAIHLATDHESRDKVQRSYDRGERLHERARLAQWWGDALEQAERRPGEKVVRLERRARP